MEYIKYYDEIVSRRQSCREYQDKVVDSSLIGQIRDYYDDCDRLVPEIATELRFYGAEIADRLGKSVGYNGFVIKAPCYFAIFSDNAEHYIENAGYIAQGIVLKLTQLDLDACWMTINDEAEATSALQAENGKLLTAIVAFGYGAPDSVDKRLDIKSPSDVTFVKSGNKVAPKISLDDLLYSKVYGAAMDTSLLYTDLENSLRAVAAAQSFFNRQPYRVIVDDDIISLIGIDDEMTNESDTRLNYGIAMFNFYAVMETVRANAPKWSFESANRDLKLPEGCTYIAKCRI